ncbi:MAG: CrcB family protein [Actinomycetota bacterium]|nr:CrcB family protein [Actinomycetota bacterium]
MAPTNDPLEESVPVSRKPPSFVHRQGRSLALVAAGGLLGVPARYAISQAWPNSGRTFPTATFVTNLTGALALGALVEVLARHGADDGRRRSARLLMGTGLCGAYTTYSTLAVDTDQLLRAHQVGLAAFYALASVVLGLVAVGVGIALGSGYHRARRAVVATLAMDPDLSNLPDRASGSSGSSARDDDQ